MMCSFALSIRSWLTAVWLQSGNSSLAEVDVIEPEVHFPASARTRRCVGVFNSRMSRGSSRCFQSEPQISHMKHDVIDVFINHVLGITAEQLLHRSRTRFRQGVACWQSSSCWRVRVALRTCVTQRIPPLPCAFD